VLQKPPNMTIAKTRIPTTMTLSIERANRRPTRAAAAPATRRAWSSKAAGAKVFDAATSVLLNQRIAEALTPGYTFVQDAAHAQYVVNIKAGTTCGPYDLAVTHGGSR